MAPSTATGWRFVERDLHDIAGRVVEYDGDARLVRSDETGQLALARWHRSNLLLGGGYWLLARVIHDLDTDLPLAGEPDGRVLRFQRAADNRGRDLADWRRRARRAEWMRDKRERDQMDDEHGDMAEKFVHALRKDVSAKPRAYVPAPSAA